MCNPTDEYCCTDLSEKAVWMPVAEVFPYVLFYCIAELAIKPCRSSRSIMRGELRCFRMRSY